MGIFNLQLFKRKNANQSAASLMKEEWLAEGMPLFAPLTSTERISGYQEGKNVLTVSTATSLLPMHMPGFGITEYRYVLDMNMIPAQKHDEAITVFAMATGTLAFYPKANLVDLGFVPEDIIGPIADEHLGALYLRVNSILPYIWRKFYPEKHDDNLEYVYYFNVDIDLLGAKIKPLIAKYIPEKFAKKTFRDISGFQPGDDWHEDYLSLFLSGDADIPVSGGDPIAAASFDNRSTEDAQKHRLSVFYIRDLGHTDVYSLNRFFSYRQRLPLVYDQTIALEEGLTLAGHPIITERTNLAIDAARVDFVDQAIYGDKLPEFLALDPDSHPNILRMQEPPSANQIALAAGTNVDLTDHGSTKFNLFNPDGLILDISSTNNALTITPDQVDPGSAKAVIEVSSAGPIPHPMTIEISAGGQVVRQLEVKSFAFKFMPVSFWYLEPFGPNDLDFDTMLAECNRIIGTQSNVYIFPATSLGSDPRAQSLQISGVTNPNHPIRVRMELTTDAQQAIINTESMIHDLNVILGWDLEIPSGSFTKEIKALGAHMKQNDTDPRPVIFIDITQDDILRIASTLAHEIGHYIGGLLHRLDIAENDPADDISIGGDIEEFSHGWDARGDVGSSSYAYNVMYHARPDPNRSLTTRQAELFNQYTDQIS